MKALVVYESMYGNTAAIGEAITMSLWTQGLEVAAGPISRIGPADADGADLLVVGGPTHGHGMSRRNSREQAASDKDNTFAEPTVAPGLREWMDELPVGTGRSAAAFDTRIDKPVLLTGSAAKGIAKRLKQHGYRLVVDPHSFFVSTKNRLLAGELDHAASWSVELVERVTADANPARAFR